jgi:hypothetical protein
MYTYICMNIFTYSRYSCSCFYIAEGFGFGLCHRKFSFFSLEGILCFIVGTTSKQERGAVPCHALHSIKITFPLYPVHSASGSLSLH